MKRLCNFFKLRISARVFLLVAFILLTSVKCGLWLAPFHRLKAHAWIEYQGFVIIGNLDDLRRFIPLPSLEGIRI